MKLAFIPKNLAIKGLIGILGALICFHLLILFGMIPFDIVWGSRLESHEQMVRFETISLLANSVMLMIVLVKAGMLTWPIPSKVIRVLLWVMAGVFVLNTLGNLLSENLFEKAVFTPLTILLALFCARLAIEK